MTAKILAHSQSKEIWKSVPGYGNYYEASSRGRVRVKPRIVKKRYSSGTVIKQKYRGRLLSGTSDKDGYVRMHISVNKHREHVPAHKLILLAFVGECPTDMECCHNDGNPANNCVENLRWDTHAANNLDRKNHGNYATGINHPMAKFSDDIARKIKKGLVCKKEAMSKYGISNTHFYRLRNGVTGHHYE